jgi:hypothetical protein
MTTSKRQHAIGPVLTALVLALPSVLPAQRVVGRALDAATNRPVPFVEVRLESGERIAGRVVTDSLGQFVLRVTSPGTYQLSTNHIGYAAAKTDLELSAGVQTEVVLRLTTEATRLPAVEVIARSREPDAYLERNGFYERKAAGFGVFRTREDIERRRPFVTSDLFTGVSGVRVFHAGIQGKDIRMTRAEDPNCPPRVLVDNVIVRRGGKASMPNETPLDALLQPLDIQAIEIYRSPSETPQEFGGNEVTCGVVLFWTKRGSAR